MKLDFCLYNWWEFILKTVFIGGSLKYSSGPILNYGFLFFASSLGLLMGVLCIHNSGLVQM